MISLNIKDYCHNCGEFEAEVEKLDRGLTFHDTIITCAHECRCLQIKNYLEKSTEKKEVHIKSAETCKTCAYMVSSGSECRRYAICHRECKNYRENAIGRYGPVFCKCLTVDIGDPCPYYKPENEEEPNESTN